MIFFAYTWDVCVKLNVRFVHVLVHKCSASIRTVIRIEILAPAILTGILSLDLCIFNTASSALVSEAEGND
jgi:hypothetical protein